MKLIDEIKDRVIRGHINAKSRFPKDLTGEEGVEELVQKAIDEKIPVEKILNEALISSMSVVGDKYEKGEIFVPEMLFSAKAMKGGLVLLKPLLLKENQKSIGTIIIGTIKGDMHDIGKNLVCMMLEGAGFEVIDLGVDTTKEKFMDAAEKNPGSIIGMSALLTVTMKNMKEVVDAVKASDLDTKVIIGGAPVSEAFSNEIGADGYALNANQAVRVAKAVMGI
ncbi:MAG: cobalamin-dependent protein [Candidatus Marinimicrobia bacterium]|jgi:5-methyltetrahydrofolate--homocysteine methyltransferase|nr:cobalamin-dependent protein [Candidatus Neomarinimicrobiota bacterium]